MGAAIGCHASSFDRPAALSLAPAVFIEAMPRPHAEPFSVLRERGAEVWISQDQRIGVRVHDSANFEQICELLDELDHDIERLDLAYLPLTDLEPLFLLHSTEQLDLTGAQAELAPLRYLVGLRRLSLAATDYASLSALADLDQLLALDLSGARANLVSVGRLSGLRELDLHAARTTPRGFELRDGEGLQLEALRDLTLDRLDLSNTKVHNWDALADSSTIRTLDLSYTNFSDIKLLARFFGLRVLALRRTAVADLSPLRGLDALEQLDVRDCELLEASQVQRLRLQRPDMRILD